MRLIRVLAVLFFLFSPVSARAQSACARLSWGSCDPWVENNCWQGPGKYQLVYSVSGVSTPFNGTDAQIGVEAVVRRQHCFEGYPDAWRFAAGQCEGTNRIALDRSSINPGCPLLEGGNPQVLTDVFMDPDDTKMHIRLAETHDAVTPNPLTRYTVWVITFDLTHANVGPSPSDRSTCGDIDQAANIYLDFAYVGTVQVPACEGVNDLANRPSATWNGGLAICDEFGHVSPRTDTCGPVRAQTSTWGRIKATYH